MLSHTLLWHRRPPNRGAAPRRLLWQLYRRPDQPTWHRADHLLSEGYCRALVARAADPAGPSAARLALLGLAAPGATPWVGGWRESGPGVLGRLKAML